MLKYKNFAKGTLDAQVISSSNTLTISTTENFPSTQGDEFVVAVWNSAENQPKDDPDREIMLLEVTATANQYNILERGYEGTTEKDWAVGDNVANVLTESIFNFLLNASLRFSSKSVPS